MADESFQERTEAPTPKRRQDARRRGELPRRAEVSTAMLLLAGALVVHMGVGSLADAMRTLFGGSARMAVAPPGDVVGAAWWLRVVGRQTLGALVPPLGAVAAMALIVGAVQARGVFATEALRANWSRLSPARNIKRIVGVRAIVELAKSLF